MILHFFPETLENLPDDYLRERLETEIQQTLLRLTASGTHIYLCPLPRGNNSEENNIYGFVVSWENNEYCVYYRKKKDTVCVLDIKRSSPEEYRPATNISAKEATDPDNTPNGDHPATSPNKTSSSLKKRIKNIFARS